MTDQPFIQFRNVFKAFGAKTVLNGVDLSIYKGEVTTIIGKSGGGKSVLLKHIIGLAVPDSGMMLFEGRPFSEMKRAEKKTMKRKFSYMFQGTALFDSMTVFENIALPLVERTSLQKAEIRKQVEEQMEQLDLREINDKYPSQLSGGMQKRVALARALVTRPEIVLFDEPTTGLDPIRKNAVHNMISDYQKKFGFTGVVVSHEIPDVLHISQRVAMLNEGQILFEGSPEELRNTSDPLVQSFLKGSQLTVDG
ncbi:ABC transporter ATP-binding protein [Desulfobacterales bacterium HSG2]|nr:ABC transporter ATP-binding protein [Desulfobacterales bacterium HSG2]